MKKIGIALFMSVLSCSIFADYVFYIHNDGEIKEEKCTETDSIKFQKTNSVVFLDDGDIDTYATASIDSITFEQIIEANDTVKITYVGSSVSIDNPYTESVIITTDGAGVYVNCINQLKDVVYLLSGTSTNGYFHIETPRKFTVVMDNLSLTSTGVLSPIRSFSGSEMSVSLVGDNYLVDSAADTCNATMRSKGQIVFQEDNTGSLSITANAKRGIQSGDYIEINQGTINVNAPSGDAVRANDYFIMNGGTLSLTGNGIDVEAGYAEINGGVLSVKSSVDDMKAIKIAMDTTVAGSVTNGTLTINDGTLSFELAGEGDRFIKTDYDCIVNGGTITGSLSGVPFVDEYEDRSYATAIKADGYVKLMGGKQTITLEVSATGARGIAADGGIIVNNNDSLIIVADCKCFTTDSNKKKHGFGLKCEGSIVFENCYVNIEATSSTNSAYCCYAYKGINIENDALLICNSYSNHAISLKEDGSATLLSTSYINFNGGRTFAFAGYGYYSFFAGTNMKYNDGFFVGICSNSLSVTSGLPAIADDAFAFESPINITNQAGESIVMFTAPIFQNYVVAKAGCMIMGSPDFKAGQTYNYTYGGTTTGGTSLSGLIIGATYTGGTTISNVSLVAAQTYTIER